MAFVAQDRVRDVTTDTASPFTVSGTAPNKYQTFDDVMAVSDTCLLLILHQTANEWEVGVYTKTAADQLTRSSVRQSSNGDAAVTFSAGTKDVIMVYPPVGTTAEYLANTIGKVLITEQVNASGALASLSDNPGGTVAVDMTAGFNFSLNLSGSANTRTLGDPSGEIVGRTGAIVITTSGANQVLAYHANWKAAGGSGSLPVISTTTSTVDILFYWVQSSTSFVITGILKAVA